MTGAAIALALAGLLTLRAVLRRRRNGRPLVLPAIRVQQDTGVYMRRQLGRDRSAGMP